MSDQVLTLFGEEFSPEQIKAVGKSRMKARKARAEANPKPAKTKGKQAPPVLENWVPDRKYYSIGEVADLFFVNTSHIRFWTNEFGMRVRKTQKGDRLYTPEQIRELHVIYHLVKEKGFTLKGAKQKLKEDKKNTEPVISMKQSLLKLRNQLITFRNQITASK